MTVEQSVALRVLPPYVQLVFLAGLAWIVRELVVRQGAEQSRQARTVLLNRLEKAYGPLYYVVGEILYGMQSGAVVSAESRQDLRTLLKTYGHELRPEHYLFCVDLLLGRCPSRMEAVWHRHSVNTELEKLRYLLYGRSAEMDAALTAQPLTVLWRWLVRLTDYMLASGVWVGVFGGLSWIVLRGGEEATRWLVPVALLVLGLWALRQLLVMASLRRRFSSNVLKGVKRGSRGQDVRLVQLMLKVLGYDPGRHGIDGVFGGDTEAALRRFQKETGLNPTGKLDRPTRVRLYTAALRSPIS